MTKFLFLLLAVPVVLLVMWAAFILLSVFLAIWFASATYDVVRGRSLPKANW